MSTIGVDIGGTKIAAGVVDESGAVLARTRRTTPATDPEAIEDAVADAVAELRAEHDVTGVGVAAAGYIDASRSTVVFAPNLAWRHEPLREEVEKRVDLPVVVENDANAAAWGEFVHGGGRSARDMVLLTVGTGLGGGIVLDGELVRGTGGMAAEVGHLRVVPDGQQCGCGRTGCWEQYGSGQALVRWARSLAATDPARAGRLLELAGGDPAEVTGPHVTAAAEEGDEASVELVATLGRWLGEGAASLAAVLDPGTILVGGGVSSAGALLLDPMRRAFAGALTASQHRDLPRIDRAELGNDAGMVGVAHLADRA
ncbi:ROK family glucokinase [Pseudokineococcus sp. 5B2Z-1]|uniref:ROK family glucokinase n=1 Tax=Pseudokineococcus sp. 5B2Z-1 TaxID=3132744 RepID=UPI0030AE6F8E